MESLIQKYRTLPVLDELHIEKHRWTSLAFGYVPSINDYQVIMIVCDEIKDYRSTLLHLCVYSLSTNSWKTKTTPDTLSVNFIYTLESVFVNGLSCWTGYKNTQGVVLCYDTISNILQTITLPEGYAFFLHLFGQSVALTFKVPELQALNMWILKQDSVNKKFLLGEEG